VKGNAVMKAKRVTGPTPNTVLCTAVALQRCSVKGCDNPPARTIPEPGNIVRTCAEHIGAQRREYQGETPDVILARVRAAIVK